jgi:hypothetical protein
MDVFVVLSTAHGNAERHGCPVRLSELQGFCGMLIAELLNYGHLGGSMYISRHLKKKVFHFRRKCF